MTTEKTLGIVLKTTKYSESSIIVKVFTQAFGMRGYIIPGVRKKNAKNPYNLFQPMSLLDMVVYEKPGRDLHHVKELKLAHVFQTIPYDIKKSSMVVFLNELIYQSIREIEKNESMFGFIYHSLLYLDEMKEQYQNFHLWFMLHYTRYLGFEATMNLAPAQEIFDLMEGKFSSLSLPDEISIQPPLSQIFKELNLSDNFGISVMMTRLQRRQLLYKIQQYYQFHLPGFDDLKSLPVMIEVLD